jgi:DNA polymerase
MVIGEAPGENEDLTGRPFCGPAGELFDKMMTGIGINTNEKCYISNAVLCRPIAQPGAGKKNRKPLVAHRKACKPYLLHQIKLVSPKAILLLGRSAIDCLLPTFSKGKSMESLAGKPTVTQQFPGTVFFLMFHPAKLLHTKRFPEQYQELRKKMWQHTLEFKKLIQDIGE